MGLPTAKEIYELIKSGATIEYQERIMELREGALKLQEENLKLRARVSELEVRVRDLETGAGETCPSCFKRAYAVESSAPDEHFGDLGGVRRQYRCRECGFNESVLHTAK